MRIRDLKPYLFGLFVYALMAACPSSCATTGKAALVFADVVDCSIESVASSALEIGGAVNRILVSGGGDWKDALGDLGRTVGGDALACAVEAFRRDVFSARASGIKNPDAEEGEQRATDFLAGNRVRFAQ